MNRIDLNGRRAVVTGAAQGIGRAVAERLLASGAAVSLWDRDAAPLAATAQELAGNDGGTPTVRGGGALALPDRVVHHAIVDVTNAPEIERAVAETTTALGGIDILVANAGISGPNHLTWEYPIEAWEQVLAINLTGIFLCCRAIVPLMIRQNYGRIVNTASIAGKEGNPNASAYSASKAGVIALTKSLGKELAGYNIAINCITPAAARTRLFEQMTQAHIDYMLSKIPRARFVETGEIASMVAWLVSEENSFTTGAVFDLSGGRATY
jgi:2-dehydro-3-deoxy-L-rhamnonate dehydrogenase (NAD+)